jgi:tetratricopeptide (TPR) repeat protein
MLFQILIGILSLMTWAVKCYCLENIKGDFDLQFAEYLFKEKNFYYAITEYKRFIFHHSESVFINYANYKIGLCYKKIKKYKLAQKFFEKVLDNNPKDELKERAYFMLAQTYIDEGNFEAARFELDELMQYSNSQEAISEAHYWKGISYLYQYKWKLAKKEFSQVIEGKRVDISKKLLSYIEAALNLPYLSKKKAMLLSTFLPGSGQIYSGKIIEGVISFILNGALGYFVWRKLEARDYLSAVLIFNFGLLRFYQGNRENAYKAAQEYNKQLNLQILKRMKLLKNLNL